MSMDTLFVVKKNVGVIEIQTGRLRGRLVNQDVDDKCCERTNTKSEATLRGKCLLTLFILLSQHFKAQKKKKRCDKQTRKWRPRKEKYPTTSGLTSKVEGLPWLKKGELRRQTGKGSGGKSACVGERKICVCVWGHNDAHAERIFPACPARPSPPVASNTNHHQCDDWMESLNSFAFPFQGTERRHQFSTTVSPNWQRCHLTRQTPVKEIRYGDRAAVTL